MRSSTIISTDTGIEGVQNVILCNVHSLALREHMLREVLLVPKLFAVVDVERFISLVTPMLLWGVVVRWGL